VEFQGGERAGAARIREGPDKRRKGVKKGGGNIWDTKKKLKKGEKNTAPCQGKKSIGGEGGGKIRSDRGRNEGCYGAPPFRAEVRGGSSADVKKRGPISKK